MTRGNPDFIAAGWGEATKAVKLPIRIAEKIQELREDGEDADSIFSRLDNDVDEKSDLDFDLDEVSEILLEALKLKANAGGKIKAKIKECLELMGVDLEETE